MFKIKKGTKYIIYSIIIILSILSILLFNRSRYLIDYAKLNIDVNEIEIVDTISNNSFNINEPIIGSLCVFRKSEIQCDFKLHKEYELFFKMKKGNIRKLYISSLTEVPYCSTSDIDTLAIIKKKYQHNGKYYLAEDKRAYVLFGDEFYDKIFELIDSQSEK